MTHFHSFITKEVNNVIIVEEFETEALIPPSWKDINANLATNGKLQVTITKFLPQVFNHFFTDFVYLKKRDREMKNDGTICKKTYLLRTQEKK